MNKLIPYLKNIFTFELFFILFLFAGRYKSDPRFAWIPVDMTALFFGISILGAAYILFVNGFSFRPSVLKLNAIYIVFVIYAFATYIWTPSEIYAKEKILYLATLTFWPLFATSIIISSDYRRIKRLFIIMVIFAFWVAAEAFIAYMQGGGWKISALGGNYLGIGRVLGPAAIIVLIYVLFFTDSRILRTAGVGIFGFFLYVQLVTGGRGPLLAVVIPMLIPLLASIRLDARYKLNMKRSFPFLLALIGGAAVGMIYLMNSGNAPVTLRRLNELLDTNDGVSSAQARVSFYTTSLNMWVDQPLWGYGVGSWPIIVELRDYEYYPHNIILETMFEFGLAGLIILMTLFAYGIRQLGSWSEIRNSPLKLLVLMIFLNTFINASFSGDIPSNRFLFGALGLLLLDKNVCITSRFKQSLKSRS